MHPIIIRQTAYVNEGNLFWFLVSGMNLGEMNKIWHCLFGCFDVRIGSDVWNSERVSFCNLLNCKSKCVNIGDRSACAAQIPFARFANFNYVNILAMTETRRPKKQRNAN